MSCSFLDFDEDEDDLLSNSDDRLPWSPAATAVVTPKTQSFPSSIFSRSSQHSFISTPSSAETIDPSIFLKPTPHLSDNGTGLLVTVDVESDHQPETDAESVKLDDHYEETDKNEDADESTTRSLRQPSSSASSEADSDRAYSPPREMKEEIPDVKVSEQDQEPDVGGVSERVKRSRRGGRVLRDRAPTPDTQPSSERDPSPSHEYEDSEIELSEASLVLIRPRKKSKRRSGSKSVYGSNRSEQNKRAQKRYRDKKKEVASMNHTTLMTLFGHVLNAFPQMSKAAILAELRQHARQWIEDLRGLDPVIAAQVEDAL